MEFEEERELETMLEARNIKIIKDLSEARLKKNYKKQFIDLIKEHNFIINSSEKKDNSLLFKLRDIGLLMTPVIQFLDSNVVRVAKLEIKTDETSGTENKILHACQYAIYDEGGIMKFKNIKSKKSIDVEKFARVFSIKSNAISEKLIKVLKNESIKESKTKDGEREIEKKPKPVESSSPQRTTYREQNLGIRVKNIGKKRTITEIMEGKYPPKKPGKKNI